MTVPEQPRNDAEIVRTGIYADPEYTDFDPEPALAAVSRLVEAAEQAQRERDEADARFVRAEDRAFDLASDLNEEKLWADEAREAHLWIEENWSHDEEPPPTVSKALSAVHAWGNEGYEQCNAAESRLRTAEQERDEAQRYLAVVIEERELWRNAQIGAEGKWHEFEGKLRTAETALREIRSSITACATGGIGESEALLEIQEAIS